MRGADRQSGWSVGGRCRIDGLHDELGRGLGLGHETCDAGTFTIVAFARSAMNRCNAGGIALSSVPSRYQHGSVFHAGGEDGVAANAAAA
jgi:hypothetical protein